MTGAWQINAPAVVNSLAGGSGAQRGVMAEMLGKVPSDWGSTIGVEGSGPLSLLFIQYVLVDI